MTLILLCSLAASASADAVNAGLDLPKVTVSSWTEFEQAIDAHPAGLEVTLGRTIIAASGNSQMNIPAGCELILDLNGKTMNRNALESGNANRVFLVYGSLTIRDSAGGGRITGGHAWGGGGIAVAEGGSLVLESGILTQNEANGYGGAIYNGGTFTMKGGSITGNQAWGTDSDTNEGGGGVVNLGSFIMTGGSISDNIAYENGGGLLNCGTAQISGGSITANQARKFNGGGIASIRHQPDGRPRP